MRGIGFKSRHQTLEGKNHLTSKARNTSEHNTHSGENAQEVIGSGFSSLPKPCQLSQCLARAHNDTYSQHLLHTGSHQREFFKIEITMLKCISQYRLLLARVGKDLLFFKELYIGSLAMLEWTSLN